MHEASIRAGDLVVASAPTKGWRTPDEIGLPRGVALPLVEPGSPGLVVAVVKPLRWYREMALLVMKGELAWIEIEALRHDA